MDMIRVLDRLVNVLQAHTNPEISPEIITREHLLSENPIVGETLLLRIDYFGNVVKDEVERTLGSTEKGPWNFTIVIENLDIYCSKDGKIVVIMSFSPRSKYFLQFTCINMKEKYRKGSNVNEDVEYGSMVEFIQKLNDEKYTKSVSSISFNRVGNQASVDIEYSEGVHLHQFNSVEMKLSLLIPAD